MTDRKPRVAKSLHRRIQDCESHLVYLREAWERFPNDGGRYKQLAGELRVLVCETKTNQPLLLNLMDELDLGYDLTRPANHPIPFWLLSDGEDWRKANRRSLTFRQFIRDGHAMSLGTKAYSHQELILTVAQQDGGSHEAPSLSSEIAREGMFVWVGDNPVWAHHLYGVAGTVLEVGRVLIEVAVNEHDYKPVYLIAKRTEDEPPSPLVDDAERLAGGESSGSANPDDQEVGQ